MKVGHSDSASLLDNTKDFIWFHDLWYFHKSQSFSTDECHSNVRRVVSRAEGRERYIPVCTYGVEVTGLELFLALCRPPLSSLQPSAFPLQLRPEVHQCALRPREHSVQASASEVLLFATTCLQTSWSINDLHHKIRGIFVAVRRGARMLCPKSGALCRQCCFMIVWNPTSG